MGLGRAADRGDIVMSWLAKVVVSLSVLGAISFDGISLLHTHVAVADTADHAAVAARDAYQDTKNVAFALAAARSTATEAGGTVPDKGMVITPDGSVRVTVEKTAPTFMLRHLGSLRDTAHVVGHGQAHPPTS